MSWEVEQPDELEGQGGQGGKYVNEPGIYHVCWTAVDENPAKRDGTPIDGTQLSLEVLAGTNASQAGKSLDILLFNPRSTDKATLQDLAKRRKFAFAYSTCLVGQHEPGKKAVVDVQQAVGRQSVVKVARKQKEENGKYVDDPEGRIELSWADIYHVDDPWVERNSVPLSAEFIAMIPASLRKQKVQTTTATSAVSAVGVVGAQPGMVAAAAAVDVGDV